MCSTFSITHQTCTGTPGFSIQHFKLPNADRPGDRTTDLLVSGRPALTSWVTAKRKHLPHPPSSFSPPPAEKPSCCVSVCRMLLQTLCEWTRDAASALWHPIAPFTFWCVHASICHLQFTLWSRITNIIILIPDYAYVSVTERKKHTYDSVNIQSTCYVAQLLRNKTFKDETQLGLGLMFPESHTHTNTHTHTHTFSYFTPTLRIWHLPCRVQDGVTHTHTRTFKHVMSKRGSKCILGGERSGKGSRSREGRWPQRDIQTHGFKKEYSIKQLDAAGTTPIQS